MILHFPAPILRITTVCLVLDHLLRTRVRGTTLRIPPSDSTVARRVVQLHGDALAGMLYSQLGVELFKQFVQPPHLDLA
jgi:hypothetical protein